MKLGFCVQSQIITNLKYKNLNVLTRDSWLPQSKNLEQMKSREKKESKNTTTKYHPDHGGGTKELYKS